MYMINKNVYKMIRWIILKYFEWRSGQQAPPAVEATIKVICHKLADEGGQPTRGSSKDEDEYWDEDQDEDKYQDVDEEEDNNEDKDEGGQPTRRSAEDEEEDKDKDEDTKKYWNEDEDEDMNEDKDKGQYTD